jgi:phytoene dehydrogenase-like protein
MTSHAGLLDRLEGMEDVPVIVIGGGLAGLTAAATLARAGRPVTLLEAAEHLGGRARSRRRDGYTLNLGPHALYRSGGGLAALRQLGVRPRGRLPRLHRAGVLAGHRVRPALGYVRKQTGDRAALLRTLSGLGEEAADELGGTSAAEWLTQTIEDPHARALAASVLRTATYTCDHSMLDAGAAAHQLRAAAHGVLYLHEGWASLVGALTDVVRTAGGVIRTRAAVAAVEHDHAVRSVRLTDGTSLAADGAVVAVNDPHRAASLLDGPGAEAIAGAVAATVPVHMAHLDLALRPLPAARYPNVFGLDEPVYLTVQSDVARVAPAGGAVIHIGRYLAPGDERGDHRASLEQALDVAQPGWRDHVVDARYVPRSMVSGDHARPATRGCADRPPVGAAGVVGLALAGDWIGPAGTLADASIISGQAAAWALMAERAPVPS